ncbi:MULTISPECIES: phosphoenolpyruvate synthase [Cyanophyceae]|uniref:phosphoenolpyruvate synthase n=1 Tax=Cyanophyceae TaxID=3028117 RepID=UPI0016859EA6|nr:MULTISPECIES: phosphoenolpyruvate synthase [Cyanophyceae]MBD1918926.1 phosphoenolpyruvate synthase [Phormidium sp. FACHB-77]MBD2033232.1 phosphoenolpyruvate synthase [Phormidium sp. FACHB-322]MBD2053835.1 phosphoenolpyruvate synthase [Leptolyngbya sp. FACHB-60]
MVATSVVQRSLVQRDQQLVLWLDQVRLEDVHLVGGKNASLGEMIQQLTPKGVRVPSGFATTSYAYRYFIEKTGLDAQLREVLGGFDVNDVTELRRRGRKARSLILNATFPDDLKTAILTAYHQMCEQAGQSLCFGDESCLQDHTYTEVDVAVRSSATAEDLPDASFAGQQETYLNVYGDQAVLIACKKCYASLFTDRAISYRTTKDFDHFDVALSVCIQRMVRSDLATSGVMFSIDTETGFQNAVLLTAAYGLGENVVQGTVNPDEYVVFKPTLKSGHKPILSKRLGTKALRMVYNTTGTELTKNEPVPLADQERFAIDEDDILQLAQWACTIEEHYTQLRGVNSPMDIEWAKDGHTGELFIVQARPETVQSQKAQNELRSYILDVPEGVEPVARGRAVGDLIGQGEACVILEVSQIAEFRPGEVLVTARTDPDWEPIMKQASAIVTDQGGRTCHAAIIARELGIPAIVGCDNATQVLKMGDFVTVSCAEGEEGVIYRGELPFRVETTKLDSLPETRTKIMMNVGNPEKAFTLAALPNDGVGLARLEFIIANHIKVHPLALLNFDSLANGSEKREIQQLTAHYDHKPDYFVDKLAQGVGTLAAAFYPKPVVVRLSDFKSNEYAHLLGGSTFEPDEENPMLGWRGASRYYDDRYRDGFALECQALKRVRDDMGLTNVILMVPFCRTPDEGRRVLEEMAQHGLVRGENGLQVYVMCELPNNVVLADEFSQVFDGFSIGSNDLTQLTLGIDRDSALVAHLFDERSTGVKRMVKMAIQTAKEHGRKIGICGQGPSDYPEFARFLVEQGIDSISLNPDTVIKTRLEIADMEQQIG